jgi:drug/metabolite transporter (DMT)-like permease
MTGARPPAGAAPWREYLRFLFWTAAAVSVIGLVGYLPTRRLAGEGALPAMLAGCAVALLAAAAGGVPIALARRLAAPAARTNALLGAMAVRFGVAVVLAVAAVLSGLFPNAPLLLWVAVGYVVLLVVETWYAVKGF